MKLSHSKLNCILGCPMTYYLNYEQGISKKEEKPALYIGSAVHWGIEHNTEDLTDYFGNKQDFYSREQLLSEAMVHGYLKHKDEIFDQILTDPATGNKLALIDEMHELYVNGNLKSKIEENGQDFVGIIDLLLLTDKGFVIIDYKTSTYEPDWNNYLDQIYRYIFLLRSSFPDVPIVKIGIVNIRKTGIRQKKTENWEQFLNRMKWEYDLNDENYVNYHEFRPESLNQELIDRYIENLSNMADAACMIVKNKMFYINYAGANGQYGKSDYWDIFYHTPDAYVLYKIRDRIWNEDEQKWEDSRDCVPIDMEVIEKSNVLNKFETYKNEIENFDDGYEQFVSYLKTKYITDDDLLDLYKKSMAQLIKEEDSKS